MLGWYKFPRPKKQKVLTPEEVEAKKVILAFAFLSSFLEHLRRNCITNSIDLEMRVRA